MPWIAHPYRKGKSLLIAEKFKVTGLPTLLVMKKNGTIFERDGKNEVLLMDSQRCIYKWVRGTNIQ